MTEMRLEKMLNIVRRDGHWREEAYKGAVDSNWYTNDATGKQQYLADLRAIVSPPAPGAVPAPVVPPAAGAAIPAGYADASFAALPVDRRQMLLADLAMPAYLRREESDSWLATGAVGLGLTAALGLAKYILSTDENVMNTVLNYAIGGTSLLSLLGFGVGIKKRF